MKLSENKVDYKIMYFEAQDELRDLRQNVKINRQIIQGILEGEKTNEQKLTDEINLLNKMLKEKNQEQLDEVKEFKQEVTRLKLDLEVKEHDLQYKENKWAELDKIIVNYARDDEKLQEELGNIHYLCDDYTTERKITTVVSENQKLKNRNKKIKKELKEFKYASEMGDGSKPERHITAEDFSSKANSVANFEGLLSNLDEDEEALDDNFSSNLLTYRERSGNTTKHFRILKDSDENTGSTKETLETQNGERTPKCMKEVRLLLPSTFKPKPLAVDPQFEFLNNSGGDLDGGLAFYNEEVSPIKKQHCNIPNAAFNFFEEFNE